MTSPRARSCTLGHRVGDRSFRGAIDDLRIYDRVLPAAQIEELALHYPAQVIVSGVSGKRTKEEAERVREYFLTFARTRRPAELVRRADSSASRSSPTSIAPFRRRW